MEGFALYLNVKPQAFGEYGIPKLPVGTIKITLDGVVGDYNVNRTAKGGNPNRAVLLFPFETIQALRRQGWPVNPGDLGENITTAGIPHDSFAIGHHYRIGDRTILKISEPCNPGTKLMVLPYVGEARVQEFMCTLEGRSGWYARVVQEGSVCRQDEIERVLEW